MERRCDSNLPDNLVHDDRARPTSGPATMKVGRGFDEEAFARGVALFEGT